MEALGSVDDLLDFSSDIGDEDDDDDKARKTFPSLNPKCNNPSLFNPLDLDDPSHSFSEFAEEELEWLSNKDAFPAVETFVDIPTIQPDMSKHQRRAAPVIEYSTSSTNSNSSPNSITLLNGYDHLKVPVRARSKGRSRPRPGIADISSQQFWLRQPSNEISKVEEVIKISTIGRKCQHCGAEKTPQWRAGPLGPKTLCNACGVRFKSGRLVPEYRPASSPTFHSEMHSNSHRKIMEMRRQKQMGWFEGHE
ncbi:GATA transcription factor 1 [Gastrolobium bilobum]|uniref:GATA transcription factor 1 n=1 Tax=Gastrolobium bilobum TaxID=150636 RepID=UPI002AB2CE8D|nr:GATA transcription factor 1 [Gastrolobium bilobum]XP_061348086.1 GATA transcription factor 1 [Gastrolobium bilobum]XP_061348087.1 GATA transcription factor 1 [Gastrolobium bilobum]